jgi:methionyl-tRNA synthetase
MPLFDQTCPHCHITEAAGDYCTACERPTLPGWVHAPRRSPRQSAATGRINARRAKESPHAPKSEAAA